METAIEINSFSKPAGFTGLRLGWTVVPEALRFDGGEPVIRDWHRVGTTIFNGASNVVQRAGLAALDDEGLAEMDRTVEEYMENARIIRAGLDRLGYRTYGGDNAPYIWARIEGKTLVGSPSREILEEAHVVTTPGSGFGPAGEGFLRFSAFGRREDIEEAMRRLGA